MGRVGSGCCIEGVYVWERSWIVGVCVRVCMCSCAVHGAKYQKNGFLHLSVDLDRRTVGCMSWQMDGICVFCSVSYVGHRHICGLSIDALLLWILLFSLGLFQGEGVCFCLEEPKLHVLTTNKGILLKLLF